MENAEMSINANAIGGFHGMDGHKKPLNGDHSDLDSGYVSNWSISHSHATASTSGFSHSAKFSSFHKRSVDLETISELQETPTTRSARILNNCHINSPQNAYNQLETTPKKGNYFSHVYSSGSKSSNKKNRSENIRWSLERSSAQRMKSSCTALFRSINENIFNDVENVCNQSIGVSPIKPHNMSNLIVDQQPENQPGLQRYPSGIESSTPKTTFRRTHTQSIVNPKVNLAEQLARDRLRKAQSFSPRRAALRETNFQHSIALDNIQFEVNAPPAHNPARKVLELDAQKFDQLIQQDPSVALLTPTKSTIARNYGINNDDTPTVSPRKYPHKSRSRLMKQKTMRPKIRTPNKKLGSLNESDILASLATNNETDSNKWAANDGNEDSLMDISDCQTVSTIKTPSTNAQSQAILSDTPIRSDFVKQNIREEANRTPTKRMEKSISCNVIPIKSSPEKEKFDIVYGHLPCTPPKSYPRRQLKRPAVSRDDSPLPAAPSAKRKLYEMCARPMFYNGIEQLDIISQLNRCKMSLIVENILCHLPDENLQTAYSVCKSWRALIDGSRKLRLRRRKYAKTQQMIKENVHQNEIKPNTINNNNIKPLHAHNKNYKAKERPTPVSPSTQKFNEHQETIKNLKPGQHVLLCPLCNGPSVVHPATSNEVKSQRRSPRRPIPQMNILQDRSLRSSTNGAHKTRRNGGITKTIVSEYAVCLKKGHEFCTNCNGNRHVNAKCTKRLLGSSPKSDEDSPCRIEYRNTKRDLRRLRRLDFNI